MSREDFTDISDHGVLNWFFVCLFFLPIWMESLNDTRGVTNLTHHPHYGIGYSLSKNSQ